MRMNIDIKQKFLSLALALFLAYLSQNVQKAECFSITTTNAAAAVCNSTRIADCIPDDEEFSMELDISRRNLLVPKVKSKTIPVLEQMKLSCDADVQASCIDRPNKFYDKRPCSYKNMCDRSGSAM